jgi:hypothetical protein
MAMGHRVRSATLVALLSAALAAGACQGPAHAEAALTQFEQLALDSAPGDSAAFATLPEPLLEFLDVRTEMMEPSPRSGCAVLAARTAQELRRRFRIRYDERHSAVLYVVANATTGSVTRVEFIRRAPSRGQRGVIWDGERDRTTSTWWNETSWGLSRRVERGEIPRGGPLPRALRGLGRQLLLLPCEPAADSGSATLP